MKAHISSVADRVSAGRWIQAGTLLCIAVIAGCSSSSSPPSSPSGVISTVAGGSNSCSLSQTGCFATNAFLPGPMGVAVDPSGNLYVGDYLAGEVFGVTATSTIFSYVVAAGFDYGAAGMAADGAGNLFIADPANNVVNVGKVSVSSAGVITISAITTVAGGGSGCSQQTNNLGDGCPATSAILNHPRGVAVDSSGKLYIADSSNNRILKVTAPLTNGVVSTVAGNGTAGFIDNTAAINAELNYPMALAVDTSGNLYITDQQNNRIRKVTVSTGNITTVAGNGPNCGNVCGKYSGDGGAATKAGLNSPGGIAVDSSGNLYIADVFNYRVRKVDASGIITTVAGIGQSCLGISCNGHYGGFGGDGGDATRAALNLPMGVAVDTSGNLYIADSGNNRVRMVMMNK
jgi:trimeric autotransporter adhesin